MSKWEGSGVCRGGVWVAIGELKKTFNTNGSAVPLVGDLDWHNSQGRPGPPLTQAPRGLIVLEKSSL